MSHPAAIDFSATDPFALPEGLALQLEIARYRAWLAEAYRTATSQPVRQLVAEVMHEIAELARHFSATKVGRNQELELAFDGAVRGALGSVATAIDLEATPRPSRI